MTSPTKHLCGKQEICVPRDMSVKLSRIHNTNPFFINISVSTSYMKMCLLEKCACRVAATLQAVISPPDAMPWKGKKPFHSIVSGWETTAHRVGSSKPYPPPLLTLFPVIFIFLSLLGALKTWITTWPWALEHAQLLASIISVMSFECSVVFSSGEWARSGFLSAKHLSVHGNGMWPFQGLLILRNINDPFKTNSKGTFFWWAHARVLRVSA